MNINVIGNYQQNKQQRPAFGAIKLSLEGGRSSEKALCDLIAGASHKGGVATGLDKKGLLSTIIMIRHNTKNEIKTVKKINAIHPGLASTVYAKEARAEVERFNKNFLPLFEKQPKFVKIG